MKPKAQPSDAEQIDAIASELNRLSYRWTDPERFFERRDQLVRKLLAISKRLAPPPAADPDMRTWRPATKPTPPHQNSGGKRGPITIIIRRER